MPMTIFVPSSVLGKRRKVGLFRFGAAIIPAGVSVEQNLGIQGSGGNEPFVRTPATRSGFLSGLWVRVGSNSLAGPVVVTVMVNGSASALALTIPAGSTGMFHKSGTVPVSSGDVVSFRIDATSAGGSFIDSLSGSTELQV